MAPTLSYMEKSTSPDMRTIAVCFTILCLVSCVTKQSEQAAFAPVYVTNSAKYQILPPSGIEFPIDSHQQISGKYGRREFTMEAWVQADEAGITISLFNSLGSTMGELMFTGQSLSFSSAFLPQSAKPEYIVADFQFCFYRTELLARELESIGLRLSVEQGDSEQGKTEVRTISSGSRKIAEITKTKHSVHLINFLRNYEYTLLGEFP